MKLTNKTTLPIKARQQMGQLKAELLNTTILNLSIRNQVKPFCVQERILRRIVEKRLAQAYHRTHWFQI